MPLPNWASNLNGNKKYGSAASRLLDAAKLSGVSAGTEIGMGLARNAVNEYNDTFNARMVLDGKDFNPRSLGKTLAKPFVSLGTSVVNRLTAPAESAPAQNGPTGNEDRYAGGDALAETLRSSTADAALASLYRKYGIIDARPELSGPIAQSVSGWQWKDYFTYRQWRTEIVPHLVRTSFEETLADLHTRMVAEGERQGLDKQQLRDRLRNAANDLGKVFTDYTGELANGSGSLVKPMRPLPDAAADKAEMDALLAEDGLTSDQKARIREAYKSTPALTSDRQLAKAIDDRMKHVPYQAVDAQNAPAQQPVQQQAVPDAPAQQAAQQPAAEEKHVPTVTEIDTNAPAWLKRAAGENAGWFDGIKAAAMNYGMSAAKSGMDIALMGFTDYMEHDMTLKGKTFSKPTRTTRLSARLARRVVDRAMKGAHDYADQDWRWVTGEEVSSSICRITWGFDGKALNDFRNVTGTAFNDTQVIQKIQDKIENWTYKDRFDNRKWSSEILPHLIGKRFDESLSEVLKAIREKYEGQDEVASRDLLRAHMVKAAEALTKLYQSYTKNIADNTDLLDAPMTFGSTAVADAALLDKYKDIDPAHLDGIRKALANQKVLTDKKALDKAIDAEMGKVTVRKDVDLAFEKAFAPRAENESADVRAVRAALAIRELKAQNESRGFFRKHVFNSAYKQTRKRIAQMTETLRGQFPDFAEKSLDDLLDLSKPVNETVDPVVVMEIEQKEYVEPSMLQKGVEKAVEVALDGMMTGAQTMVNVTTAAINVGSEVLSRGYAYVSNNYDDIKEAAADAYQAVKKSASDGLEKTDETAAGMMDRIGDYIADPSELVNDIKGLFGYGEQKSDVIDGVGEDKKDESLGSEDDEFEDAMDQEEMELSVRFKTSKQALTERLTQEIEAHREALGAMEKFNTDAVMHEVGSILHCKGLLVALHPMEYKDGQICGREAGTVISEMERMHQAIGGERFLRDCDAVAKDPSARQSVYRSDFKGSTLDMIRSALNNDNLNATHRKFLDVRAKNAAQASDTDTVNQPAAGKDRNVSIGQTAVMKK